MIRLFREGGTFGVNATAGVYPRVGVESGPVAAVGLAGGVLLAETVRATGLAEGLCRALAPWRKDGAVHDPGKIITDLALSVALGGGCLSDLGLARCEPTVFGKVASIPTACRLVGTLAGDIGAVEDAITKARAQARKLAWALAGRRAPTAGVDEQRPLVVDIDATVIGVHSEKEGAAGTFKRGFGFHPLTAWIDHGQDGTGECAGILLRPGNAGSNTAADHVQIRRGPGPGGAGTPTGQAGAGEDRRGRSRQGHPSRTRTPTGGLFGGFHPPGRRR